MAQINFNSIQTSENSFSGNSVDFFSLKNDGDTAIVRFMHDSTESFELLTVHDVVLNDKYRKANCIRQPNEPLENCPLCATGKKVQQRFFIHLIQYVQDSNGTITGIPKVWERPASYAYKLKNLIDEYGPLSEVVFKVKRNGAKGSKDTTYDIMFCNPAVYNNDYYAKMPGAFDTYSALGSIVLNKNFDELLSYVETGAFPQVIREEHVESVAQPSYNNPSVMPIPNATPASTYPNGMVGEMNVPLSNQPTAPRETPIYDAMVNPSVLTPNPTPVPNMGQQFNTQQPIQRPIRSYN